MRQRSDDSVVVSLAGEVTYECSRELRERLEGLLSSGHHNIVADLSEVSYIDSSGLAAFLSLNRKVRKLGGRLMLVNVSDRIMRALRQARVCELLPACGRQAGLHDKILTTPVEAPLMARTICVPCDPSRMGETRREAADLFEALGLAREVVFDLTLALGEALGNAFDHGEVADRGGSVTVTVSMYRDRVVVEVADTGCGCGYHDGDDLPMPTETRGRGIRLMMMLADGLSITPRHTGTGTVVRFVKMLDGGLERGHLASDLWMTCERL